MRIVDRYLIRGFAAPFFFCVTLFTVMFVVIDSLNNLDEYIKHSVSLKVIFSYYFTLLPTLVVQMVPLATLVAILYILGNLNRHHEIIAMKASGISSFQILSPYLFTGILLSFAILLTNENIVPQSSITSRAIFDGLILKGKEDMSERAIKNVTLYTSDNRMIYAREYEIHSQSLHDVIILENNADQSLRSKMIAKSAEYQNGEWVFRDVMRYEVNRRGDMLGEPVYSTTLALTLPEKPENFLKEASQVEFMSAKQLKEYIENLKGTSKKLVRSLWVEFHYKLAFPFVSLMVMLIGAPLALRAKRGSAVMGIGTSLVIVFAYYGLHSFCIAMGKGGYLPPFVAAWFSNLLFAGVGIYLIRETT
jgi:lipopolysaccharide export system permease protein